ncbi:MAG: type II secretion system F family protein, partial [Legionellaceae bacterium]|nr:type II secretion system F family protein [Legionellaceae bacterium]
QTDPYLQYILMNIRSKILEGFAFADALREFPKSFPEVYCASIAAGEHTGKLDIILNKLAEYIENQEQIRQKIKNALIYPLVMIVVSCSIIGFLLTYVVPKMIEVFASNEQSLPLATRILLQITAVLSADGLFILFFFLLLGIAFYRALRYPKFQWHVHRLLLRLPFFAYLQRTIYVARYIHTFSILFGASVPILDTMRVSTKMINNRYLRKPFEDAMLRVQEGISIYTALRDTRALTPMTEHMIASGEKSGQLSNMMERAAAHLEQEVDRIINTSLNLLEPLIIVLMGAMVLFIVLATLLPIFSMEQLVSG